MKAELYIRCSCVNGEGPVWDEARQCLHFVDVLGNRIHTWENGELTTVEVGENIGCAVPRSGGGMVAGLLSGWYAVDLKTGEKQFLCDPEPNPRTRCNDGKADPFGNLWIGCMSRSLDSGAGEAQPEAGLYCMTPDGQVKTMLTGLYLGNGLAWSGDGRKFYYIDTMLHNVQVFDFDPDTVTLSNGREAFAIPAELGLPDGMTIDCQGKLWIAMFGGGAVLRFDPDTGALLDRVELPCPNVTCACFGGRDMDELFITTGAQGTDLAAYPLAGSVFRVKVGIKGAPSYSFRG